MPRRRPLGTAGASHGWPSRGTAQRREPPRAPWRRGRSRTRSTPAAPPVRRRPPAASAAASPLRAARSLPGRSAAGPPLLESAPGSCRPGDAPTPRLRDEPAAPDHADHHLLAGDVPVGVEDDGPGHPLERRLAVADLRQVVPERAAAGAGRCDRARQQIDGVIDPCPAMVGLLSPKGARVVPDERRVALVLPVRQERRLDVHPPRHIAGGLDPRQRVPPRPPPTEPPPPPLPPPPPRPPAPRR